MALRKVLSLILCFTLLLPLTTWAESTQSQSSPFKALLDQHREIKVGVGSIELMAKHGKELADATYKLMRDPSYKKFLSTPEGVELRSHQQMLVNFLAVKDHFDKCIKNKEARRKLHERVLQASMQSMGTTDMGTPCGVDVSKMPATYLAFNNDVMRSMKAMVRPYFQNQMTKQVMINSAKSLLGFKVKFQPDFMKNGVLTKEELDGIVDRVCLKTTAQAARRTSKVDVCEKMDPSLRKTISKEVVAFSQTQVKTEKFTAEKATKSLNEAIGRINRTLEQIQIKKDVGIIYDSANLTDEKTKQDFELYVSRYAQEISSGAGALLLTDSIRDEAGGIKQLNSSEVSKEKSKYQFKPHKEIKVKDVRDSIVEAERKITNQIADTLSIATEATRKKGVIMSDEDDIKDLVKINPFAGGQVLLREPQYAGLMCDAINKINEDDVDHEERDRYFLIGSAVLGGALLLTGVGAIAGSYLITGSLTAGVAAGTIGGTVMGYSAIVGTAGEMVSLSYRGKRAYDHYTELNRLEEAFLAKNGDQNNLLDARHALSEFKEARLLAILSLTSIGLNTLQIGKIFNLFKNKSGDIPPEELSAMTKIFQYISTSYTANKIKEVAKALGDKGMEKIDNFLLYLAKAGEANRLKFLELLSDSKVLPQKIKDIMEVSLEAAKACEKV